MISRSDFDAFLVPSYAPAQMVPVRGEGAWVWDQEGKDYLDFSCGIAVTSLGHCPPVLVEALQSQARKLWHVSNTHTNEPALALAKQLVKLSGLERAFFCNSGAEANEAALKMARRACIESQGEEKTQIISFEHSFHGRTLFTVSAGGTAKYREKFGPLPADILHLPWNDVEALERAVSAKTCAIILEPVQGEGGVQPATQEFVQRARELATDVGAALIFDEVQIGCGRSGQVFAYQEYGVMPDILTLAKGLGGGFPIGATLAREQWAQALQPGTHGTTYGGNALACAVAGAMMEQVSQDSLLKQVRLRSKQLREGLEGLRALSGVGELFGEIRGMGLLLGVQLPQQREGLAGELVKACAQFGLLTLPAGKNTLRLAPPLNLTQEELEEGLARLQKALHTLL